MRKRGLDDAMAAFEAAKAKRMAIDECGDDEDDVPLEFPACLNAEELKQVDVYKLLHIKLDKTLPLLEAREKIKADRARHAFHRLSQKYHPRYGTALHLSLDAAHRAFQEVCFAFNVLRDRERKQIYDTLGIESLRQHESYMQNDIFEQPAQTVYDDFFDGKDNQDKLYLLLNGPNYLTDSEEEEEEEEDAATDKPEVETGESMGEAQQDEGQRTPTQQEDGGKNTAAGGCSTTETEVCGNNKSVLKASADQRSSDGAPATQEDSDDEDSEIAIAPEELGELKPKTEAAAALANVEDMILNNLLNGPSPSIAAVTKKLPQTTVAKLTATKTTASDDIWVQLKTATIQRELGQPQDSAAGSSSSDE